MYKAIQTAGAVVAAAAAYWMLHKTGAPLRSILFATQLYLPFLIFAMLLKQRKAQAESGLSQEEYVVKSAGGRENLEKNLKKSVKTLRFCGNCLIALPLFVSIFGFIKQAAFGIILLLITAIIMWPTAALLFYGARKQEAMASPKP